MDLWTLVRFLHVLALAFFVGGQLMLLAAVVPALRGHDEATMRAVARRFGWGSVVALGVLVASGVAMAERLGRFGDPVLHAKLGLLVLVGVLAGLHVVTPHTRVVSLAVFAASVAIVWLGVILSHG